MCTPKQNEYGRHCFQTVSLISTLLFFLHLTVPSTLILLASFLFFFFQTPYGNISSLAQTYINEKFVWGTRGPNSGPRFLLNQAVKLPVYRVDFPKQCYIILFEHSGASRRKEKKKKQNTKAKTRGTLGIHIHARSGRLSTTGGIIESVTVCRTCNPLKETRCVSLRSKQPAKKR